MSEYKVPYTFIAGTRAKASQVNANFETLVNATNELSKTKANIEGNADVNFSVAEPILLQHAATKRYVDLAVAESGGSGGSGVGKSMFEVFHTLSTKTPPGAFSLRTGELILDAENDYPSFYYALQEQGTGIISDFTDVTTDSLPEGYSSSFTNVVSSDDTYKNRAFSPYSWFTTDNAPSSSEPIVAELEFPILVTCSHFKINSHVINTYNSVGDPDPARAIKVASISIRQADDTWVPVTIINETEVPTSNERYFANTKPDLEFNAVRIVVAENFGADQLDLSVYPVSAEKTSVRVVPEEQWQWEVETYHETGAFVLNTEDKTIRLPKITRFLSGVSDLWQIGMAEANSVMKSGVVWQEGNDPILANETEGTISLDSVSTGLWIQAYNSVADEALANIKYVPHATLFEERGFRFQPAEETGWVVSDGNWRDGNYYVDAMTELLNQNAQAVAIEGKNYRLAPNGMKFVTDEVYQSTYKTYGEVPYYVVDNATYKFKTPMSNNYARYTSTLDDTGELLLDAAPNITGTVGRLGKTGGVVANGAFYHYADGGDVDYHGVTGAVAGFDASRSNSVYGRKDEIQPKSSKYLMCVFLGNEIPQSSSVDVFLKIKALDQKITELDESSTDLKGDLETITSDLQECKDEIQTTKNSISSINSQISELESKNSSLENDIVSLQDKSTAQSESLARLELKVTANEQTISEQTALITKLESDLDLLEERVSTLETSIQAKADLSAVEEKFGGLKLVKTTEENYASLEKDASTLYLVTSTDMVKMFLGDISIS